MRCARILLISLLMLLLAVPTFATPDSLTRATRPRKDDLAGIIKGRQAIRVLVSYNRTNFFLVDGAMRGLEYDFMKAFEKHLSKIHGKDHIHMVFVALPFDDLIPALLDGRGDIIAAGMTATTDRKKQVAFSTPYRAPVTEIIVGSKRARPILKLSNLAGKTVHVMAGSSYVAHLEAINTDLKKRGIKPIKVKQADPHLVTEDLLQMAQAGMVDCVVAEMHTAQVWQSALTDIQLFTEAPIHSGGELAWAVRPNNPTLLKQLSDFASTVRQGTLMGNMVFKRYFVNTEWVNNPNAQASRKKLKKMATVFQKYGKEYDFDWLKLAALAFQESRLDMNRKSAVGAIGVMQIRPSTAKDPNVNIKDIDTLDGNIHAGTKYLRFLRDNYFTDVDKEARVDFALAAYNAGPARVIRLRKVTEAMGLDPNKWFGNVEWAAYREIGKETPTYVANVQMYYAAYKSINEVMQQRRSAK